MAYVTSYSTCEIIDPTDSAEHVREEHKYRHLYVRKLLEGEDPKHDIPISLGNVICHSYYGNESYRKNVTPYRMYFLKKSLTLK